LDRNFCSNKEGEKEKIILSFIMKLAEKLNVDVLCEGVETKELIDFLQSIGCNIVQGFYYDRPLPSEEFKNKYLVS
ncbi:MAG: EAL domain-containing protein, partial [Acholeplasmatales bacterium]|nr:EAL domain-containing protein [Acholeplasmatales bacterium]